MFFELLQVALGNRVALSTIPSNKEWSEMYAESERQAITGVLLHGIEKLAAEQRPPQALLLQWIGISEQIRLRNALLDKRSKELLANLTSFGLRPTILKGQGIAMYYGDELRQYRQAGDIDAFINNGREKAIAYAKSIGQKELSWDYVHLHLKEFEDVEVELHYRVDILLNVFRNKKLQKWFKNNEKLLYCKNGELTTPTIEMNIFYVLLHIYIHFLTEGVGLRQLMDYYFVLLSAGGKGPTYADNMSLEDVLKKFGMWKFAQGIMWVMQECFTLERKFMYCEPSEKEGRLILNIVLEGGNFGHNNHVEIKGFGKMNAFFSVVKHNLQIMQRHPSEALLSPFWFVWHKCWKLAR